MTAPANHVEHFSTGDGLTSDNVSAMLDDREGGTWVVSTKGLDKFRQSALIPVSLPKNWSRIAIAADGPDSVLAASRSIVTIDRSGATKLIASLKVVSCAYRDPLGTIWIGEDDGLWRYTKKGLAAVTLPPGLDPIFHVVQAMTMDRSGGLWVSFLHTGFMYYSEGRWTHPPFPTAATHDPGLTAYTDSRDRLWFGLKTNRVQVLNGTERINYGPQSGIDVGDVTAIHENKQGTVWVGGLVGLNFPEREPILPPASHRRSTHRRGQRHHTTGVG